MFSILKKIFGSKPVETVAEVPYKVEAAVAPVASVADKAVEAVVKSVANTPKKPAPKKPAGQKSNRQKPAGKTSPRKPKSPTKA